MPSNIVLVQEGLNLIHEAGSAGVYAVIKYFLPVYDHRIDPTVHSSSGTPQTEVSALSDVDSLSTTTSTLLGEKIWNINNVTGNTSAYTFSTDERLLIADVANFVGGRINYISNTDESQDDTARINLLDGHPLSNVVSATSFSSTEDVNGTKTEWGTVNGAILSGYDTVPGELTSFNRLYEIHSYSPITDGSTVKGLYKCRLDSSYGNFKFNKIVLYVVKLDSNYNIDTGTEPKIFAVVSLNYPVYKSNDGTEITNFDGDVEIQLTSVETSGSLSAVSFYRGTEWSRTPDVSGSLSANPAMHWDGYVGIRTYLNGNQGPQRPLHIIDNDVLMRLGYSETSYCELEVNNTNYLIFSGTGIQPKSNDIADIGSNSYRWKGLYASRIVDIDSNVFMRNYDTSVYSYSATNIGFLKTKYNSKFVDGDVVSLDKSLIIRTETSGDTDNTDDSHLCLLAGVKNETYNRTHYYYNSPPVNGIAPLGHREIIESLKDESFFDVFNIDTDESELYIGGYNGINFIGRASSSVHKIYALNGSTLTSYYWSFGISTDNNFVLLPKDWLTVQESMVSYFNFKPGQNEIYDIGDSSYKWANIYLKNLYVDYLISNSSSIIVSNNLLPNTSNINIGSNSLKFAESYLLNVYCYSLNVDRLDSDSSSYITLLDDIIPSTDDVRSLGDVNTRFNAGYFNTISCNTFENIDSDGDTHTLKWYVENGTLDGSDIIQINVTGLTVSRVRGFNILLQDNSVYTNWRLPNLESGSVIEYNAILLQNPSSGVEIEIVDRGSAINSTAAYRLIVWYY